MRDELNSTCDTNYKIDVIKKALLTHRYTWKKIERITREQDHMLRREYHETIKHIKSWQIYFFDESHIDETTGRRPRGRSRRGRKLTAPHDFMGTRTHATLMGLFSLEGFVRAGCQVVEGTVDADSFLEYVHEFLVSRAFIATIPWWRQSTRIGFSFRQCKTALVTRRVASARSDWVLPFFFATLQSRLEPNRKWILFAQQTHEEDAHERLRTRTWWMLEGIEYMLWCKASTRVFPWLRIWLEDKTRRARRTTSRGLSMFSCSDRNSYRRRVNNKCK